MMLRVLSLFSGVGTFDYGFHLAGWQTIGLCEWDPKAREVLAARFPGVPITNDVRELHGMTHGPAEVVTFGSPCQDLSVAGKRAGLDGARSGLFMEAVRIIREMREGTNGEFPRFALWENVPGAFSSNGGRDFAVVLRSMAELGALDITWRTLDSQFFGVPQRRRRIFLVADFGGERAGEVLAFARRLPRHSAARGETRADLANALTGGFGTGGADDNAAQAGWLIPVPLQEVSKRTGVSTDDPRAGIGIGHPGDPMFTLQASAQHGVAQVIPIQDGRGVEKTQNGLGVGMAGDPAYTLDTTGAQAIALPGTQPLPFEEAIVYQCQGSNVGPVGTLRTGDSVTSGIPFVAFSATQEGGMSGDTVTPPLGASNGGNNMPCVAFSSKDHGADAGPVAPTLRAMGHNTSHMNGGGQVAVAFEEWITKTGEYGGTKEEYDRLHGPLAFDWRASPSRSMTPSHIVPTLEGQDKAAIATVHGHVNTLTTEEGQRSPRGDGSDNLVVHTVPRYIVRRLTPVECERLQAMPDNWTALPGMADSHRYRFMGNGGTATVLREIAERMKAVLDA